MNIRVVTVSGAAKREQLVTEAPSSVTVVTAAEIATYGWRTLVDVLRATRGFYTTYDRNYAYLGARGFGRPSDYNNRVLLLINGHRMNDNVYDAMGIGTDFPVDLALVERIEVIRGPGSALYGTSAFFAVINVITRQGGAVGGAEGSIESASLGTWRARATYGATDGTGRDVLLSVSHMSSRGAPALHFPVYDDPVGGPGVSRGADGDQSMSVFAAARLGAVSFEGALHQRDKELPGGAWDTGLSDPRNQTRDTRSWLSTTWGGEVGQADVTARAFYDHMGYAGTYALDDDVYDDYAAGDWLGGEVTATRVVARRHRLTTGAEYRGHLRQLQSLDEEAFGISDLDHRSQQLGLYVQDEVRLTDIATAIVGARADYWSLDGWTAHPRLGLVVRPDAETSVKLLYGSAYRAPNAYERFFTLAPATGSPSLRPERLRTGEFVAERYVNRRLRLTATAYLTHIERLISQNSGEAYTWHENGADVRAVGAEVEAERRWTNGLVLRGSLTRQRTRDQVTREPLSNSPHTLAYARAELPLWNRANTLGLDWQHVSKRLSNRGAEAAPYQLTHLTWRYVPRLFKGSVSASVYNLFDTQYANPVGVEFRQDVLWQDGRTFSVRATVGF